MFKLFLLVYMATSKICVEVVGCCVDEFVLMLKLRLRSSIRFGGC